MRQRKTSQKKEQDKSPNPKGSAGHRRSLSSSAKKKNRGASSTHPKKNDDYFPMLSVSDLDKENKNNKKSKDKDNNSNDNNKSKKSSSFSLGSIFRTIKSLMFAREGFRDFSENSILSSSSTSSPRPAQPLDRKKRRSQRRSRRRGASGKTGEGEDESSSSSNSEDDEGYNFQLLYGSDDKAGSPTGHVSAFEKHLVRYVDAVPIPSFLRPLLFDSINFCRELSMKRRVYFIVLFTAALLFFFAADGVRDAWGDVTRAFVVSEPNRPGLEFIRKYQLDTKPNSSIGVGKGSLAGVAPSAGNNATVNASTQEQKRKRFAGGGELQLPHKQPVIIVPGFITGALELWEAKNISCLKDKYFTIGNNFRQRMFGPQMLFLVLTDPQCWLDVFSLDKKTGLDPENVKVRADSGFASVDYFVPGFWVWAKILINLADIGYDPQSVVVMTYDWRLSPASTHDRDGFFYNMRSNIKFFCQKNRRKSVVISHSYGTTVALSFFRWIGEREPQFVNRFVSYWINVGGVTLGIPKAMAAMLLGDVKDTMSIPAPARRVLDNFLSQSSRSEFTRSYSCLAAMLPRGCEEPHEHLLELSNGTSVGLRDTFRLVRDACAHSGHEDCVRQMDALEPELEELPSLPQAPDMTVVCLYGVNKAVEVGYHVVPNPTAHQKADEWINNASYSPSYANEKPRKVVGGAPTLDTFNHSVFQGVRQANGDGTVPLTSLAYMCRAPNGWRQNVGRVVTMEYNHMEDSSGLNLRDGSSSGDHVNVLGNFELIETILKIASGVDYVSHQDLLKKKAAGIAVDEDTDDRFESVDPSTGQREVLHRRVHDRIYSDIDHDIKTRMKKCLKKKNNPIVPKSSAIDDNEFL